MRHTKKRFDPRLVVPGFRWFVPSFHGDVRMEAHPDDPEKTVMTVEKPTVDEQQIINKIGVECANQGWIERWEVFTGKNGYFAPKKWEFVINAPVTKLGPVVAGIMRPGPAVLHAIRIEGDKYITSSGGPAGLEKAVDAAFRTAPHIQQEEPMPTPPEAPAAKEPDPKPPEEPAKPKELAKPPVAATVKRHTPSCPQCMVGAIKPATEVLLSFLTEEQHESWRDDRTIVVVGGITGYRYLIAHRNSPVAARVGRICYDLDNEAVVHFHDRTVPPEEEVLAAKLILEHREGWLRNEATYFSLRGEIFKNPFGDMSDGAHDAGFMNQIGQDLFGITGWGR